ncbi:MAG: hypothetical protein HY040_08280 [Planctomycetes bacterium]|nr:hypothetical protein [Planctomycetota bacterium]
MTKTFIFEELDDVTQSYLRKARDSKGLHMTGVFALQGSYLPWFGLFGGLAVIILAFWFTLPPLGEPVKAAMLQAAGLLLGGWMIVAAVRVWSSRRSLGNFVFADGVRLWEGRGEALRVTDLAGLEWVDAKDNYNEGKYTGTAFTLNLEGRQRSFSISNGDKATQMYEYLQALSKEPGFGSDAAEDFQDIAPGEQVHAGAASKVTVAIAEHSPSPERVRQARSGIIAYAVIVLAAVVGVILLTPLNTSWRDDAIFDLVKTQRPPYLRDAYLIDPRNTRHREEVEALLARFYAPVIKDVQDHGGDKDLSGKFVAVLEKIKTAPRPTVSIRVRDESKNQHELTRTARADKLEKRFVDAMSAFVSDDMIEFVKAPDEARPIFEIEFAFEPTKDDARKSQLTWTVRIRQSVDEEQALAKTWTSERHWLDEEQEDAIRDQTATMLKGLIGVDNPLPRFIPQRAPGDF